MQVYGPRRVALNIASFSSLLYRRMDQANSMPPRRISNNINIVTNKIFAKEKWREEIAKLGLHILFYGIDLKRFPEDASTGHTLINSDTDSAYIAMGLVSKTDMCLWPTQYTHGYPLLRLFFQCLKPWKWLNKAKHEIFILESKIELNISVYALGNTTMTTPTDIRLVKQPEGESEVYCDATDADGTFHCIYTGKSILFLTNLWGLDGLRQFYPQHNSNNCWCNLENRLKDVSYDNNLEYDNIEEVCSLPLLDTPDTISIQSCSRTDRSVSIPSHLPAELCDTIAQNLDPATLLTAVRQGLPVLPKTYRQAQHTNVWSVLLRGGYNAMKGFLSTGGNLFAMGLDVEYLYDDSTGISEDAVRPLSVILSWTSNAAISLNWRRFDLNSETTFLEPFIRLRAISPYHRGSIGVRDVEQYIRIDEGKMSIPVVYFQDADWKIHPIGVEFDERNSRYFFMVEGQRVLSRRSPNQCAIAYKAHRRASKSCLVSYVSIKCHAVEQGSCLAINIGVY